MSSESKINVWGARMPLTHAFKTAKLMLQAKAAKEKDAAEAAAAKEAKK